MQFVVMVLMGCGGGQGTADPATTGSTVEPEPVVIVDAQTGDPQLQSADRLTFAPAGHLVIGDGAADRIVVVATGDLEWTDAAEFGQVPDLAAKAARGLGVDAFDVRIADIAVNPRSGRTWVAVERQDIVWAGVMTVEADRSLAWVDLADLEWVSAPYPEVDGPGSTIADLEWTSNWLVAAVSEGAWSPSQVVTIAAPVVHDAASAASTTHTYHRVHRQWETLAPITTLFSWTDGTTDFVGASYACAPVVRFAVEDLAAGTAEVVGVTPFDYGGGRQVVDFAVVGEGDDQEILASVLGLGGTRVEMSLFERDRKVDEEAEVIFDGAGEPVGTKAHRAGKLADVDRMEVLDAERLVVLDGVRLDTVDRP